MKTAQHEHATVTRLAETLREESCPQPETYLPWVRDTLDPAQREALDQHSAQCAACAAERALAESFDDTVSPRAWRLAARLPAPGRAASDRRGLQAKARARWQARPAQWPLAMAAGVAVFAAGLAALLLDETPRLPTIQEVAPEHRVTRGAGITLLRSDESPQRMRWTAVAGVDHYRVTARNAAGDLVWRSETTEPWALPPRPDTSPGLRWQWQVEAFDENGALVAQSTTGEYEFSPGAGP